MEAATHYERAAALADAPAIKADLKEWAVHCRELVDEIRARDSRPRG